MELISLIRTAFTRRTTKWTVKFVIYLVQIAMYNALVLYRAHNPQGEHVTMLSFLLAIVKA